MSTPRLLITGAVGIVALVVSVLAACVGEDPTFVSPTTSGDAAPAPSPVDGDVDDSGSTLPVDAGAGADAQDVADGSTRFCASQAAGPGVKDFFCADFDGTDPAEGFTSVNVPDGGALSADWSGGTVVGKRYVDDESGIELLGSKAGAGSLAVDGRALRLKEAKPLPASD